MIKPTFVTGSDILIVTRGESAGSITLNIGPAFSEPIQIALKTKEEFSAFVGELYRMWDQAQEAKSI